MALRRWDPFGDMRRMQESMDHLWRGLYPQDKEAADTTAGRWPAPLDVMDRGDKFVVEASLPGVTPEDIEVSIEGNVLSIKGAGKSEEEHNRGEHIIRERRTGSFHRSLRLPNTVDTDRAEPHYENGVLTITLPKADAGRVRQVKVTTGKTPKGETK